MTAPAPPTATPVHPPNDSDDGKAEYAIDVRLFLLTITTVMAISFGAGVAFGPTPSSMSLTPLGVSAPSHFDGEAQSLHADEGGYIPEGSTGVVKQKRRLPTAHSAELGDKITTVTEHHVHFEKPSYENMGDGAVHHPNPNLTTLGSAPSTQGDDTTEEEEHLPAGQHLLVDIKNVEAAFLNSEDRLAKAMVDVVSSAGLTLLSYHCHSLQPAGVSCVGVLLESHISFHTWPDEGVITLDLFTCGSNPLLPVVPTIERLFGIPRKKQKSDSDINATFVNADGTMEQQQEEEYEKIVTLWSHELRGFRHHAARKSHYLDDQSDLAFWVVSPLEMLKKEQIVSVRSPYQQIDIWDALDVDDTPSYEDAMKHGLKEGDPRWMTPEIASPERLLFLDGTLQSLSESEREYHEALVHPAMFAHPNPTHVAIVGGGEGATLREVLKHKTIERVTMIEIDQMLADIARQYLAPMSNCSDLEGRSPSCFEDPKARVLYQDGRQYFRDRYGPTATIGPDEMYDVIVVDSLDPEENKRITDGMYGDYDFLSSLYASMSPDGVLVIQVGTAPNIHDPKADVGVYASRERLFKLLESHPETGVMLVYEEAHCGFNEPHSFLVVCKDVGCRKRWYSEADAIDYQIYERIVRTKSKNPALVHFDGSTQHSYHTPPKAWETVYCRREPEPFECAYRGLDLRREIYEFDLDSEQSSFEVKWFQNEGKGWNETAVFATQDIPKGSYIMPEHLASSFIVSDDSLNNLRANTEIVGTGQVVVIEDFLDFIERYGHKSLSEGSGVNIVEVGASFMIRKTPNESEANVGRWMPPHPSGKNPPYSPVYERHRSSFDVFLVATKDIKKGDEILKPENLWEY